MMRNGWDAIVIGAGVSGCAAARFLSRFTDRILVLECGEDVCSGTSKANSGIIHAGFDAKHGSMMAKMNVAGSVMMPELARQLDIPFERNGSLVAAMNEKEIPHLEALLENGRKNGVEGLRIVRGGELKMLEPNLADDVAAVLYAPTGGIVCPFILTIALAENAAANGVQFRFGTRAQTVSRTEEGWTVQTDRGTFTARAVINAAGVYADLFHNQVSRDRFSITARAGEYFLLDHQAGTHVRHTVFRVPGKMGKGVLVTPTVHGNLLVGPTAADREDREETCTTASGLEEIRQKAGIAVKDIPFGKVITSFAGLRAHSNRGDFIIGSPEDAPGFYDFAGMESPGLSSACAIGKTLSEQIAEDLHLAERPGFAAERTGILDPKKLSEAEYAELIRKEPAYGRIVCRCETVTEGEILDAIRRPVGARSLDGVKRRTRAGMGRCQSGFCSTRVMQLLASELGEDLSKVTKSGGNSVLVSGRIKDALREESPC